jgi:hypothetical protein
MKSSSWKSWLCVTFTAAALVLFGTACATGDAGQEKSIAQAEEEQVHEPGNTEHSHGEEEEPVNEEGDAAHTHGNEGEHAHEQGQAEHSIGEEREHTHDQEGEESGKKLALTDTYDQVRNGVRLVMAYHNASSSFVGSVENTTDKTIKNVRVEVHLSTGVELGPTKKMDLAPGEKAGIKLEALGHVFEWWTTHAETGTSAHTLSTN